MLAFIFVFSVSSATCECFYALRKGDTTAINIKEAVGFCIYALMIKCPRGF